MPMEWCVEKVATLLMWSGTEVAQAVLGNRAISGKGKGDLNMILYVLAHVCAKQDRQANSTYYLRYMEGGNGCI